jgi:hypothetical protein
MRRRSDKTMPNSFKVASAAVCEAVDAIAVDALVACAGVGLTGKAT